MRKHIYSQAEVRHIFIQSENRPSPVSETLGHSEAMHNAISRDDLERRKVSTGFASAFVGGFKDQIRAATDLLNSPDGQTKLGQLDDAGAGARRTIEADVVPAVAFRFAMGLATSRVFPAHALPSTRVRMVVDSTEDSIHIHTIFPLVPGND
jgi:hypothetical protein